MCNLQSPDAFRAPEIGDSTGGRNAGSSERYQMTTLQITYFLNSSYYPKEENGIVSEKSSASTRRDTSRSTNGRIDKEMFQNWMFGRDFLK